MKSPGRLRAVLASLIAAAPAAFASPASDYESARALYASGAAVDPSFKSQVFTGKMYCPDAAEPAVLAGPEVRSLRADLIAGKPVFIAPGDGAHLKTADGKTILELVPAGASKACYGVFARLADSEPVHAAVEETKKTLVTSEPFGPGIRYRGELAVDLRHGNVPLATLGTSSPYQGPAIGLQVERLQRFSDSAIVKRLDVKAAGSYTTAYGDLNAGLADVSVEGKAWVSQTVNFTLGHERWQNRGIPSDAPTYNNLGARILKATWAGINWVPTGMDELDNRIAYGLKIYRIPGHCGGGYEDTCYVGGASNNNKPARERGELVPATGWEAGIEVSRVVGRNVRIPFTNAVIEKIVIGTQGSLIGGTPFDNAEALSYGASLSAYLTKRLVVGIRGTGLYNLNHEVVRDERNARHDTALTQYGPFVAYKREW